MRLPGYRRQDPLAPVIDALADLALAQRGAGTPPDEILPQELADELHKQAARVRAEAKRQESKPAPVKPKPPAADEAVPAPATGGRGRGRRAREPEAEA